MNHKFMIQRQNVSTGADKYKLETQDRHFLYQQTNSFQKTALFQTITGSWHI